MNIPRRKKLIIPSPRCALHLIKDDASDFLRRCSIICLEDTVLHPDLPLLVWLMAAQAKGYKLGPAQVDACLRIVFELASVPVMDSFPDALGSQPAVDWEQVSPNLYCRRPYADNQSGPIQPMFSVDLRGASGG